MHIIYNNNSNNNNSNHVTFSCNTSQLKQDTLILLDIMSNQMEKLMKILLRQDTINLHIIYLCFICNIAQARFSR